MIEIFDYFLSVWLYSDLLFYFLNDDVCLVLEDFVFNIWFLQVELIVLDIFFFGLINCICQKEKEQLVKCEKIR